jgi:tRNA 2-thiouridine synthesizing protein E
MSVIAYGDVNINIDDEGYLADTEDWNERVACGLAEHEGIEELTKERMDVIRFMRDYYKHYNAFPILRSVCRNIHQPKNCVREDFIDPIKAWKIAGLPKPNEQVVSDLEGKGGVV